MYVSDQALRRGGQETEEEMQEMEMRDKEGKENSLHSDPRTPLNQIYWLKLFFNKFNQPYIH